MRCHYQRVFVAEHRQDRHLQHLGIGGPTKLVHGPCFLGVDDTAVVLTDQRDATGVDLRLVAHCRHCGGRVGSQLLDVFLGGAGGLRFAALQSSARQKRFPT